MTTELMNPCGEFSHEALALSPRPGLGEGTTVGLFNNSKKNAELLLDEVAKLLAERYGGLKFVRFSKEASLPAEFPAGFLEECDVVVAALAD